MPEAKYPLYNYYNFLLSRQAFHGIRQNSHPDRSHSSCCSLWITYGPKIPLLGKLPGDIRIEKENFTLYIPLGTSLLISALLSLLFWIFRR